MELVVVTIKNYVNYNEDDDDDGGDGGLPLIARNPQKTPDVTHFDFQNETEYERRVMKSKS